jgi:hypothetical protein
MLTLGLTPSTVAYMVASRDGLSVNHTSPRSRFRKSTRNTRTVRATWKLSPIGYQYMRAFYRTGIKEGSEPFIAKIVFDEDNVTLHKAVFVPGTFRTTEVTNYSFTIEADMLVERRMQ